MRIATGILQASELPSKMELHPSLSVILGVLGGILIVFFIFIFLIFIIFIFFILFFISTGILQASELPSKMELHPSLSVILGVLGGILIVFFIFGIFACAFKPRRQGAKYPINQVGTAGETGIH